MKLKQDIYIGKNLQRLRIEHGYSQESLARTLQNRQYKYATRDIITKIETGRSNIRISLLVKLKELYDVPYEEFFKNIEKSSDCEQDN